MEETKYYIKYKKTGEFDGFLINSFNEIPLTSVIELSEKVYNECLNYTCDLKSVINVPICISNLSDIEIYFNKKSLIEETDYIDPTKMNSRQIIALSSGVMSQTLENSKLNKQVQALSNALLELQMKGMK